jgi:hypothetical protein
MTATYSLDEFIGWLIEEAEYYHECGVYGHDSSPDDIRLTKPEFARLCAEAVDYLGSTDCRWCGANTSDLNEWYMVKDFIWRRYGPADGCLCIGCLEDRMGRRLRTGDFKDVPLNKPEHSRHRSDRLRDRLGFTVVQQP